MQEGILTPDQYKDLSKKIIHAFDTRYRIIPLNSLKHPKYHLKAPIYRHRKSALRKADF